MCSIDGRGELNKDTYVGFRVEEADHTGEASSGRLIDELDAFSLECLEFRADVVDLVDHAFVPRASTVPKTERRDFSRFERKSATAPMVVARQVGFWPHGLKMTRFICPLAFAKRRSCPRGWFHDRRRWGQAP